MAGKSAKKCHTTRNCSKLWFTRPRLKYMKRLTNYVKDKCSQIDALGIDLLEQLLIYNPKNRLSAHQALNHPWFSAHPVPCQPFQIQKMDKEYHEYMHRAEKHERLRKEKLEQQENLRREQEMHRVKLGEQKKMESKESINRLESLLKPAGKSKQSEDAKISLSKRKPDRSDGKGSRDKRERVQSDASFSSFKQPPGADKQDGQIDE